MKTISIILCCSALLACSGGRDGALESRAEPESDPYAEARALFEVRREMRQRAEDGA